MVAPKDSFISLSIAFSPTIHVLLGLDIVCFSLVFVGATYMRSTVSVVGSLLNPGSTIVVDFHNLKWSCNMGINFDF